MSVNLETPVASSVANGVTVSFPYAFTVLQAADLKVKGTLAGVTTLYTYGVHYTISGLGTGAGSADFLVAPANGTVITRYRDSELVRSIDYQDNGDLLADTINLDVDRGWLVAQEQALRAGGAVRAPYPEQLGELPGASQRAGMALVFDGAGAITLGLREDPASIAVAVAAAAASAGAAAGSAAAAAASDADAAAEAGIATAQAVVSAAQATAATAAKVAAEAARDAANNTGKVFANTAAGIAGTVNGQSFAVVDASLNFWIVYQNNAGVALEMTRAYTKTYMDTWLPAVFETLDTSIPAAVVLDADRRIITRLSNIPVETVFETLDTSYSTVVVVLDADRRIMAVAPSVASVTALQTEVTAARGTAAALATRLARGLTPYGDPLDPVANAWSLRETRMRLRRMALGEAQQLVMAFIGDSYTQAPSRYVGPLAKALQTAFGSAGIGWLGFGWYGGGGGPWVVGGAQPVGTDLGARYDLITTFNFSGNWACTYNTPATNTPSLSYATSSTAGNFVQFTVPAGHNACRLFYGGDGTGVVQVSWDDGGSYSANINLNTVGAGSTLLAGIPGTAATARIKVISGNVSLAGVDLQSANSGVRIHKLGGSGSSAAQWAAVTGATWAAQMLQLGSHMHQVMHGTNDQGNAVTPAAFATSLGAIFTNLSSVLPYSDKLIVMPPENQRLANAYGMPAYSTAAREYAVPNDCAFQDLQYYFGSVTNFAFAYANANAARPWYAADLIHPDPNTGGRAIVDAEYRLLTSF